MQRWQSWVGLILGLNLLVMGIWGVSLLRQPDVLPITSVKIYSDYRYIDPQSLQQEILPFVDRGFFAVNVNHLKFALQRLPWVYQVAIKRIWPDQVIIKLIPKKAVARWGKNALLSEQGVIFTPDPKTFPDNLVRLNGPNNQVPLVWRTYVQMNSMLKSLNLRIIQLNLTERHAWWLILNNGIKVILGHAEVLDRLQRFMRAYPKIMTDSTTQITAVDVRYPDGLAVKFRAT